MRNIRYDFQVESQLEDSIRQLVERQYFSEEDYAIEYMRNVINYFQLNLNNNISYEAPSYFNRYGYGQPLYYSLYRKSTRTSWYAFYEKTDSHFNIVYLGTNHLIGHYLDIHF